MLSEINEWIEYVTNGSLKTNLNLSADGGENASRTTHWWLALLCTFGKHVMKIRNRIEGWCQMQFQIIQWSVKVYATTTVLLRRNRSNTVEIRFQKMKLLRLSTKVPKEATSIFIAGIFCENLCPEVVGASFLRAFGGRSGKEESVPKRSPLRSIVNLATARNYGNGAVVSTTHIAAIVTEICTS